MTILKKNIAICAYGTVGKALTKFILGKKEYIDNIKFVCTLEKDIEHKNIKKMYSKLKIPVYENINVNHDRFKKSILENNIDIVFLLWWPTIVKQESIDLVNVGYVNLHPSLLPFNRGMHPYYWSIVKNTPSGVSIHFINKNIDEGELICQKEIKKDITETGESLYKKAHQAIIKLFKEHYVKIIKGKYNTKEIKNNAGTFHLKKELDMHSMIDLDKEYKAINLINIIRARSFKDSPSSFFYLDGKKYFINIKIKPE